MVNLKNKTALITGASSGVGKAVALLLAKNNCNLVCISREKQNLETLKQEVSPDISFHGYVCNLSNETEILDLMKKISADIPDIDIVIHSAGLIKKKSVTDASLHDFDLHFNLNVKAPFLITKLVLPQLQKSCGQIVFVNSSVVKRAIPELSLYSASKHALKGFADSLRQEVNEYGIRVFTIFLGQTATPMQQKLYEQENKPYFSENLIQTADIGEIIIRTLELPKTAEITDLFIRPLKKQ